MSDKLPSIDDFYEELPSIDEIITEEKLPSVDEVIVENKLPSVDKFIEPEEEEEPIDAEPCSIEEQYDGVIKLIDEVRQDIPEIPEIKYYDEQLEELTSYVEEVKENIPTYDGEISAICNLIDELKEEVRTNAASIPEIRYYDDQIESLESSLKSLPEIRHYEEDIAQLKESISDAKVNHEDDINSLEYKFNQEIKQFGEDIEVKSFDKKIEIDNLRIDLEETSNKIYEELKKSSDQIHEYRLHLKDDDRKLKKQILGQYNLLKENIEKKVKEFNNKNIESQNTITGSLKEYFDELQEKITNLPEVKYYDKDIKDVRKDFSKLKTKFTDTDLDINELRNIVEGLKETQKQILQENLLAEPPEVNNEDPLTPLDQNFVTLDQLQEHYRLFVNRVQQQLSSFGGGGAVRLDDLEDVDSSVRTDISAGELLIYNGTNWVGIDSTSLDTSSTLHEALLQGNVSGIGMSVGVITATNGYFSGIVTAASLNYDVVTDIYSTGIVTATKGIQQTGSEGLHVTAGVSTFVGLTSCLGGINVKAGSANTSLIVEGDARIIGVLTVGSGSVTIDKDTIHVGTGITLHRTTGNMTVSGIITAGTYHGDGSGLIGVASTDNISSGTTANLYGGLKVGSAATIATNGNATYSGIVTAANFVGGGANITALSGSR